MSNLNVFEPRVELGEDEEDALNDLPVRLLLLLRQTPVLVHRHLPTRYQLHQHLCLSRPANFS